MYTQRQVTVCRYIITLIQFPKELPSKAASNFRSKFFRCPAEPFPTNMTFYKKHTLKKVRNNEEMFANISYQQQTFSWLKFIWSSFCCRSFCDLLPQSSSPFFPFLYIYKIYDSSQINSIFYGHMWHFSNKCFHLLHIF